MTARVFVDTNIFVYARDSRDPVKKARAPRVARYALARATRAHQRAGAQRVLHDGHTRSLKSGLSREDSLGMTCELLMSWNPQPID